MKGNLYKPQPSPCSYSSVFDYTARMIESKKMLRCVREMVSEKECQGCFKIKPSCCKVVLVKSTSKFHLDGIEMCVCKECTMFETNYIVDFFIANDRYLESVFMDFVNFVTYVRILHYEALESRRRFKKIIEV